MERLQETDRDRAASTEPSLRTDPALGVPLSLDVPGVMALQRSVGNAAVGRVLSRQQASDFDLLNPFETDAEADARRATLVSGLRQPLLDALRSSDGMAFLSRLRGLTDAQRILLEDDPELMEEVGGSAR